MKKQSKPTEEMQTEREKKEKEIKIKKVKKKEKKKSKKKIWETQNINKRGLSTISFYQEKQ